MICNELKSPNREDMWMMRRGSKSPLKDKRLKQAIAQTRFGYRSRVFPAENPDYPGESRAEVCNSASSLRVQQKPAPQARNKAGHSHALVT
eukprot:4811285-Amphidinium_carterae.1